MAATASKIDRRGDRKMQIVKDSSIRRIVAAGLFAALTAGAAACGTAANVSEAAAPPAQTSALNGAPATAAPASQAQPPHVHLYLTIVTGKMNGKPGWPEYIPGNFSVPAGAIVDVQIRDFDSGAAAIPGGYNKVIGTVGGTIKIIKAVGGAVDQQPGTTVAQVPANDVAHTFTINENGFNLNVPVPPLSTVEFSFKSPAAGTYDWQCFAACGTGQAGWGGPMATDGWMKGVMTVQ